MSRATDGFSARIRVFTRSTIATGPEVTGRRNCAFCNGFSTASGAVDTSPMPSGLYSFAGYVSQPVRLLFRLRATGLEHIPSEGGFVLASNHTSNFDPWPLGLPLFPRRQLRFMAKSELYWFPLSLVLNGAGAFPVRRGERDLEAIETAVALAREGEVVMMFPEGTRRRKGLRKRHEARPHTGAARI